MQKLLTILIVALATLLSGCAASVQRPDGADAALKVNPAATRRVALYVQPSPSMQKSADWELFRTEWRSAMAAAAANAGKPFTYYDVEPAGATEPATLIVVTINDYRYISPGARYGLGVLTGNAYIDADARFYELPQRQQVGARKYATTSTAWQGVFSAMTEKQVQAITTEMIKELDAR